MNMLEKTVHKAIHKQALNSAVHDLSEKERRMSEISEIEIKSMTKEQNYMRGYEDGKSDVLDKIRAEIVELQKEYQDYGWAYDDALEVIDKYKAESEDKE